VDWIRKSDLKTKLSFKRSKTFEMSINVIRREKLHLPLKFSTVFYL